MSIFPGLIEDTADFTVDDTADLRKYCTGLMPLTGRVEPWMTDLISDRNLPELLTKHGSPLNLITSEPMRRNVGELNEVAKSRGLDFRVFFARKSNKCLTFVEAARDLGIGLDTASENELQQCLDQELTPPDLICSAAIKNESLLRLCITKDVCIAVDNMDELEVVSDLAHALHRVAIIALRIGGFVHQGQKLLTRFGFDVQRDIELPSQLQHFIVKVEGIHFHLDGYDPDQRVTAILEAIRWIEALRFAGHFPSFIDMGGGCPMSYLEDELQWERFWVEMKLALTRERTPLTYRGHGLGLVATSEGVIGQPNCYPYFQTPTRSAWLASILDTVVDSHSIAYRLRHTTVQLRCEPGRSLMDGCGMTLASVEFRKQNADGDWLIGLSMNRTQCRTSSDDFLVDPILIPTGKLDENMSGYLVGAYCTESELLSLRKMNFPHGVRRGDLIVFPNTAGYLMHFLESRSHQLPLAENLNVDHWKLDKSG